MLLLKDCLPADWDKHTNDSLVGATYEAHILAELARGLPNHFDKPCKGPLQQPT